MFRRRRRWRLVGRGLPIVRARRGERIEEHPGAGPGERIEPHHPPLRGFPGRGKPTKT